MLIYLLVKYAILEPCNFLTGLPLVFVDSSQVTECLVTNKQLPTILKNTPYTLQGPRFCSEKMIRIYRVSQVVVHLVWVDIYIGHSTTGPNLLGQLGVWQNWLWSWAQ